MAGVSKNARTTSGTQKFECPCGGEIKMKSIFSKGKMRHYAHCEKCDREERRPSDFK
jgi:transcription elongation factor Elf1